MHVFPFFTVTLVIAQNVVKKLRLPQSTFLRRAERKSNCAFQSVHPLRKVKVITTSNEEMHVIRHDYISSYGHTKLVSGPMDIAFERTVGCA